MFSNPLNRVVTALLILSTSVCAAGCTSVCTPGDTQDCSCGGGEFGVQSCNTGGTGWGACLRCSVPAPTPDAGPPMCYPRGFPMITCNCSGFALFGNVIEYSGCCSHQALVRQCTGYCSSGIGYPWEDVCL